jgi:hypothetical protein
VSCGRGGGGSKSSRSNDESFVILSWDAPTTKATGAPLDNLSGYKIYYGNSSNNYITWLDVGNVTTYRIKNLPPGTYYFIVTAYNTAGDESLHSNEVSKIID